MAERIHAIDPEDPRFKSVFEVYKGPRGPSGNEWIGAIKGVAAINAKSYDLNSEEGRRSFYFAREKAIRDAKLIPEDEKLKRKTYDQVVFIAKTLKSLVYSTSQGTLSSHTNPGWSSSAQLSRQKRNIG